MRVVHFSKIDRAKEAERFLLGRDLAPKMRELDCRSCLDGAQGVGVSRVEAGGGAIDAPDKVVLRFFARGQQILMLINLLLALAIINKDTLFSKKEVLKIIGKDDGDLKDRVTTMETLSAWLQASKNKDNLYPDMHNIFSNNSKERTSKNLIQLGLLANKVADATNQEKYRGTKKWKYGDNWSDAFRYLYLTQVENYKNWIKLRKSNTDADKEQENNSLQPISTGVQANYNTMKKMINLMSSVRSLLARF